LQGPIGAKYRVIAIDLPGHGASSPPPHPESDYSGRGYAAAISAVARELDLRSTIVVGWSLGGHSVLNAAGSLPMAAGLMIFGTPPIGRGPEGFAGFKGLSKTVFTASPSEAEIQEWAQSAFAPGYKPIPDFLVEDFRRTDGNARACLGASAQSGGLVDEVAIVGDMKIPLAIVQGREEQIVDLGYLQRLPAPTLWRGTVQVIDGAGHSPQWEQADAFNGLLDAQGLLYNISHMHPPQPNLPGLMRRAQDLVVDTCIVNDTVKTPRPVTGAVTDRHRDRGIILHSA